MTRLSIDTPRDQDEGGSSTAINRNHTEDAEYMNLSSYWRGGRNLQTAGESVYISRHRARETV